MTDTVTNGSMDIITEEKNDVQAFYETLTAVIENMAAALRDNSTRIHNLEVAVSNLQKEIKRIKGAQAEKNMIVIPR